jgi:hypothetical protein
MHNCKSLMYNGTKQEAISPVHANLLVKWDVARSPRIIAQQHVLFHWPTIPQAVLLPDLEQFAIAHTGIQQSYIDIYSWDDLSCIDRIAVPHAAYEETDDNDPFTGHDCCPTLSHLSITPCGTYLVVIESEGDVHLLHLTRKTWTRLKRRNWADYSEMVAFDRTLNLAIVEFLETDAAYEVYRIDDLSSDRMTHIGRFDKVHGCHRGQLLFNPFSEAIVRTGYRCDIDYYTFETERLLDAIEIDDGVSVSPNPYLTKRWTQRFPYIQHPHSAKHPWQSSLVFQDANTLLFAAGEAIVQINATDGAIMAEYQTSAVVNAIALDATQNRVIAATDRGLIAVAIAQFDPETPYLKSLQARPEIEQTRPAPMPQLRSPSPPDRASGSKTFLILGLTLILTAMGCFGIALKTWFASSNDFPPERVDRNYFVGQYQIREKIHPVGSNFPDQKYERVYTLYTGSQRIELGRFMNEDNDGIKAAVPKVVGEWLVVFSASKTFLWKAGNDPIAFEPYRAENWMEYSAIGINGHYDYNATDFSIQGDRWILEYRCATQPCSMAIDGRTNPEKIRFFSEDGGKTFYALKAEKPGKLE